MSHERVRMGFRILTLWALLSIPIMLFWNTIAPHYGLVIVTVLCAIAIPVTIFMLSKRSDTQTLNINLNSAHQEEISILQGTEERMKRIKDSVLQNIDGIKKETFLKASALISDSLGVSELKDTEKMNMKLKKKLEQALPAIQKQLDEEHIGDKEQFTKRKIELVSKVLRKEIKLANPERILTVADMISIGKTLDGMHIGLTKVQDKDRKYKGLYKQIRTIKSFYSDQPLNRFIDGFLQTSYGFNSWSLYVAYLAKFDPHNIVEATYPQLIEANWRDLTMQSDERMSKLLTQIVARMKELKTQEQAK